MSESAMLRCAACGSRQQLRATASGSDVESVLAPTLSVICVGCWNDVVEENERLRAALANPCNFTAPCGNCEACEKTKQVLAGGKR